MMEQQRTYGWYAKHYVSEDDGTVSERRMDTESYNAPTVGTNLENLEKLGILDKVPTAQDLAEFIARVKSNEDGPSDWRARPIGKGRPMETMHWIIFDILRDPTTSEDIIRAIFEAHPDYTPAVVHHPNCPRHIIVDLLTGSIDDPTHNTKGGEIAIFVLHNRHLASDLVDMCARRMRKSTNQKEAITHPNVSRSTLVYLVNHGKTHAVKRDALMVMFERGWLTVA